MLREVFTLMKANGKSHCSGKRDRRLDAARLDTWDVNISFTWIYYMVVVNVSYQQQVLVTRHGKRSRRDYRLFSGLCPQINLE